MKLNYSHIINREHSIHGKTAFVVGLGPSAKNDIPIINKLRREKEDYVIISCNDYDLMTDMNADYWVHANSVDTIGKNFERYNKKNSILTNYWEISGLTSTDEEQKIIADLEYRQ